MPKLVIKKDDAIIKKLSVPGEVEAFTVGCERGNDIIIKDKTISFFHLQFEKQNTDYYVRDLQSQWGTYVNGEKISNRTVVRDLDEVSLGQHKIVFLHSNTMSGLVTDQNGKASPVQEEVAAKGGSAKIPRLTGLNEWLNQPSDAGLHLGKQADQETENNPFASNELTDPLAEIHAKSPPDVDVKQDEDSNDPAKNNYYTVSNEITAATTDALTFPGSKSDEFDLLNGEASAPVDNSLPADPPSQFDQPSSTKTTNDTYYLLGIYGYYLGRRYKVKEPETKIGRDSKLNDIIVRKTYRGKLDQSVSRRHATLKIRDGAWFVFDKRSQTRTWVNRNKLSKDDVVKVDVGDEIEIGSDQRSHIFRMVKDGDWNYSFPVKAGPWFIRNFIKILNTVSVSVGLACMVAGVFAVRNLKQIKDAPAKLTVQEKAWGGEDIDLKFANSPDAFIYPAISDLNKDGVVDVVYVNDAEHLACIDGATKERLWLNDKFEINPTASPALADIFSKGAKDILIISSDSRIRLLDGQWGIEISRSPILSGPLQGPPVVADFDQNGLFDIAVASRANVIHIGYGMQNQFKWTSFTLNEELSSPLSVGDVTGDGIQDIIAGTPNGKLIVFDGFEQKVARQINLDEEFNKASGRFDSANEITFPPALADFNSDGVLDVATISTKGNLMVLAGGSFERLWYDLNDDSEPMGRSIASLTLADLDGDRKADIILQSPQGKIRAMRGMGQAKDRKIVWWEFPDAGLEQFIGSPISADFDKNGSQDIFCVSLGRGPLVLDGETGFPLVQNLDVQPKIQSQAVIGDLDSDNYMDVLLLRQNARLHKLATNAVNISGLVLWSQSFADNHNSSLTNQIKDRTKIYMMWISGAVATLVLLGSLQFFFRRSRKKFSFF